MGSVLQFAVFFCICSLIRGVATHPNQDEDKKLNNKPSNPNSPGEDFYFVEEKGNGDTVKSGRAISKSAWSKETKEPSRPDENKNDTQFTEESSIKKFITYLLNVVHELKKDIFGIKEMALLKETKELPNSQDSSENKGKQNKMEENHDVSKPVGLTENTEFRNKNQPLTSNYITDYYRENGIKFTDDEEKDDDLENFSDVSDDSSHKPNIGANTHEVGKNIENTRSFKSVEIKRNPDTNSFETKKTTAIPSSLTKIPKGGVQEFDENKESGKCGDCKESITKTEQIHSKESRKGTESEKASPPNSKGGKCVKRNDKNPTNNLKKENEPTKKSLKSEEYITVVNPQNDDSAQEESKRSDQDKTPGKNSKNKDGSDFDNKPGFLLKSTAVPSQNSRVVPFSTDENKKEPKASGAHSKRQQEQIASPKPEDKKQIQNNAKFRKDNDGTKEHTTVSLQSRKPVLEIPEQKINTETYTFDTEIDDSRKESKGERSKVIPTQTIVTYNENEPNSEINRQQTSNSFDIGDTIVPTTSGSKMNTDKLNKYPSDNLSDKTGTTEHDKSEKSNPSNDSETQKDNETEQTEVEQVNDDSQPGESLKNEKLIDSNTGKDDKEKDDLVDSTATNDILSQDSNHEIQNHGNTGPDKQQETQANEENLTKRTKMQDSPDHEYEFEEDTEDFDIWDESDTQNSDQNQEDEQNANDGDKDEMNQGNTETVLTKESQISQHTGQSMAEKSQEQFDTFLEYFYKYSNNSFFQSLKNQSESFSDDEDGY